MSLSPYNTIYNSRLLSYDKIYFTEWRESVTDEIAPVDGVYIHIRIRIIG